MTNPPPGWPDKNGLLAIPATPKPKRKRKPKRKPKPANDSAETSVSSVEPLVAGPRSPIKLPSKGMDIIEFNRAAEDEFVKLVRTLIKEEGGSVSVSVVRQEAAYLLGVSVETAKRYIEKYTARSAPFMIEEGMVTHRSPT